MNLWTNLRGEHRKKGYSTLKNSCLKMVQFTKVIVNKKFKI